jgi:hypothetical protein
LIFFKLLIFLNSISECRDGTSATPNGTIQRSADDTSTDARMCMFAIAVPSDHRIQLKCSNVTISSADNYLQVILCLLKPNHFRYTN